MKLDADCVRAVLLETEKLPYGQRLQSQTLYTNLKKFSKDDINYSVIQLKEAGYIDAVVCAPDDGVVRKIVINDITYNGQQFLDKIRKPSVWGKIMENGGKVISSIPALVEIVNAIASLVPK